MYTKKNQILSGVSELANYIDGYDVYNSSLLERLHDPSIQKEDYEITVYQYRPDLIAADYYRDSKYTGILMLQVGISLESYTKGVTIKLIPKTTLDEILRQL